MHRTKKIALSLTFGAMLALGGAAHAGKITGVRVEPPTIVAGAQAKVTVDGEDEGLCGLRVEYGNGDVDTTKMIKDKDNFPRSFMHAYNNPGTYTVVAKGGRDGSALGCLGAASTTLTVLPPPPPMPTNNPPPMPSNPPMERMLPQCPDGFVLNRNSYNRRTGAFSCTALRGAQLPPSGMNCPPDTSYYTNVQGTLLGCRAIAPARQ
jgi:hypothetical protein